MEDFENEILNKIDNNIELSEQELKEMIFEYSIEDNYGENRRWSRTVYTVCKLKDRYFMLEWENGLTECQENEYWEQPYEVYPHTYEKTITVTEWKELKVD